MNYFHLSIDEVESSLKSNISKGLSNNEVIKLQSEYGPNELKDKGIKSPFFILLEQLGETLVLILIIAAVISAFLGEIVDSIAIAIIVILNAILGVTQEYRAEKAMLALKKMSVSLVKCVRDGVVKEIAAPELVPGDVVYFEAGNIVPADCRLIECSLLRIQEAALTGESEPMEKQVELMQGQNIPVGDQLNMAFMGTLISNGRGKAIVTATAMNTELGKIASMIQNVSNEPTPLQKRLSKLGQNLAVIAFVLVAIVFILGISRGNDIRIFLENVNSNFAEALLTFLRSEDVRLMFLTAVSLAVAAVPEGLPAVVTIALALGARKMLKRNALIRKLPAVETLGSVTTICSDKTGTLTENRMTVTILDIAGHRLELSNQRQEYPLSDLEKLPALALLLTGGALCNDAVLHIEDDGKFKTIGDPTENALLIAASHFCLKKFNLDQELPRINEVPFDSERKMMSTVHQLIKEPTQKLLSNILKLFGDGNGFYVFTKGAVDSLLKVSTFAMDNNQIVTLDKQRRERIINANDSLAQNGMRILGIACKKAAHAFQKSDQNAIEHELVFIGMSAMIDPPRAEVKQSVIECKLAGIRPVMITGDHPLTASYIASELGIKQNGHILTGQDLNNMSQSDLDNKIENVSVFARVSPEHKLRIIQSLQKKGHVVAMTGDGVNDAPALKKADIGVAMGITGTDVSKEASDMVLLDDNFATIVSAVAEGRVIYDNIKKFLKYLMTSNSGEIWVMLFGPFLGMPLALLPLQILWINLVTDGFPALALGIEKAERNTMCRPPYHPGESIFAGGLGLHILWVGLLMGAVPLLTGFFYWLKGAQEWQTMIFTILTFSQLGHALAIRSNRDSLFTIGFLSNKTMASAIILSFILQLVILYTPLRTIFGLSLLSIKDLCIAILLSSVVFWAVEFEKLLFRSNFNCKAKEEM